MEDIGKGWGEFVEGLKEKGLKSESGCGRWYEEHLDFDPEGAGEPFGMDLYVELG